MRLLVNGLLLVLSFAAKITRTEGEWTRGVWLNDDGTSVVTNIGSTAFNSHFSFCPVVQYTRNGEVTAVYVRTSPIPSEFNAFAIFTDTWASKDNELNTDFKIYNSLEDAKRDVGAWTVCNYDDADVGFPRDCGQNEWVSGRWFSMPGGRVWSPWIVSGIGFDVYTGSTCHVPTSLAIPFLQHNINVAEKCCFIIRSPGNAGNDTFILTNAFNKKCPAECAYTRYKNLYVESTELETCLEDIPSPSCCSYDTGALCTEYGESDENNIKQSGTCSEVCKEIADCTRDSRDDDWCKSKQIQKDSQTSPNRTLVSLKDTEPDPVDCRWNRWSEWGQCSQRCGGGTRTRTRSINREADHGGEECRPPDSSEEDDCNTSTCGCSQVLNVPHSTYTSVIEELVVRYSCDPDYIMEGNDILKCTNGAWSPSPPSCHPRPPSICDRKPCHFSAYCSPISSGYQCECKEGEDGDPYKAGCHLATRFSNVIPDELSSTCGYKPDSSSEGHVQCGGTISAREAPWQVSIISIIDQQKMNWCGGVLITSTFVLSAAHCFESTACNILSRTGNNKCVLEHLRAFFGRSNTTIIHPSNTLLEDVNSIHRTIEKVYIHPDWQYANPVSGGNDISILTVQKVPINNFIKPACLPNPSTHFFLHQVGRSRRVMEISGFGRNNSDTPLRTSTPHQLQLAEMKIIDKLACDSKLRGEVSAYGEVSSDIFCAIPANDGGKDCLSKPGSCEGDSGGPGVVKDTYGQYVVIGLVSGGPPCGEDQSVHPHRLTSVSHHLSFILNHTESKPCPPLLGDPIPPTCDRHFVEFVSDLRCFDREDCPKGSRCLDYHCTLYKDDAQARLAKTPCKSSQQCQDGAYVCDDIINKCRPDKAINGTRIQVSGGIQTLLVPRSASQGLLPANSPFKQSTCPGHHPCPVKTTNNRTSCQIPLCSRFRRCWCRYPASLRYDVSTTG